MTQEDNSSPDFEANESFMVHLREGLEALVEESTEDEKKKQMYDPQEIKAMISNEDTLKRYLISRSNNWNKALAMLKNTIQWRTQHKPATLTPKDFPIAHPQGVWRMSGYAKDGSPILLVKAANWRSFDYGVEEYISMVSFHVEQALTRAYQRQKEQKGSQDNLKDEVQLILIFDMRNMSYMSDIRKLRALVQIVTSHYPERLRKAVCVNCDWIFDKLFHMMVQWVDQRTANKCVDFRDNGAEHLLEHIDADQLFVGYGGSREEEWPLEPVPEE